MTCKICGMRPAINQGATCGNSYCQEAAYYLNAARNARGSRNRELLHAVASKKIEVARTNC